jgi:UDP-N-acetylmuramyl pentapeptide phosphotransferase/UDP-N-acetylglucosamine-1-phosphate transferase
MTMTLALTLGLTAALSWLAADVMRRYSARLGLTDLPNDRSSHTTSRPRAGGIGFAFVVPAAIIAAMAAYPPADPRAHAAVMTGAIVMALVGLADDRWTLSPFLRLAVQCAAAMGVIAGGAVIREIALPGAGAIAIGPLAVPVTLIWIVGLTNIYNFMDGIDGIAACQAIVTGVSIAALAACVARPDVAFAMAALAAGVAGFLVLNWPPARIFMGDVGSTFLGFFFAAFAAMTSGSAGSEVPLLPWLAVLSPFLVDATWTLLRRAARGEQVYQAHRTHAYQRLVASGWSHANTTGLYAALAGWAGMLGVLYYCLKMLPASVYVAGFTLPLFVPFLAARWRRS